MTKIKYERVCYWWEAGTGEYRGYCCNGELFLVPHKDEGTEGTYSAIHRTYMREVRE